MADNYRLPKTPAGDDGSGPLIKTKQNGDLSHSQGIVICDASGNIIGNSAATPVAARLTDGTSYLTTTGGRISVDGSGVTQPVSGSVGITGALPAGTNNIGDVDIASGSVGITGALPAGTNNIGDVDIANALPAGSNLIGGVHQRKPPGYANRSINTVVAGVAGGTAEALVSMVSSLAGVDSAANTVFTVTAGKTFRITGLWVAVANGAATQNAVRIYLRANPAGAASATSPIQAILGVSAPNAVSGGMDGISSPPLDIDIPAGWGFAVTRINAINSGTVWVSLTGYEFTT